MVSTRQSTKTSVHHVTALAVACGMAALPCRAALAEEAPPQPTDINLPACAPGNMSAATWRVISIPPVGEEQEVEVGGSILSTAKAGIAEAGLKITAETTAQGKRAGADYIVTIPPTDLPALSSSGNGLHPVPSATFRYLREKGERHGLSKPQISVAVDPANQSALRVKVNFGLSSQDLDVPAAQFSVEHCLKMNTGGFRREILYSGGSKGTIQLQYREYINDLARPAFSQELSYDLADGVEIGFKGARIRVLKISNVGMRYAVLKPLPETSAP